MNSLNIKALSLSLGVTWAIGMLFLGWAAIFGWGFDVVDVLATFYLGYNATFIGAIVGAVWGFVYGALTGLIIGYFYNLFGKKKNMEKKVLKKNKKEKKK